VTEKLIVSLAADSDIRCRRDSGLASLRLFTVRVVAKSGAAVKTNAGATIAKHRISIASERRDKMKKSRITSGQPAIPIGVIQRFQRKAIIAAGR
jgi:uncharacterized protein YaiI (UPF0178 family)